MKSVANMSLLYFNCFHCNEGLWKEKFQTKGPCLIGIFLLIWHWPGLHDDDWKFISAGAWEKRTSTEWASEIAWRLVIIFDECNWRSRICHFACLLKSVRLNFILNLALCRLSIRSVITRTPPSLNDFGFDWTSVISREI